MTFRRFVIQSLKHYWRTHIWVMLGAAIGVATLSGALFVGDSVDYTLSSIASARLGKVGYAVGPIDRYFLADLADRVGEDTKAHVAPVLYLRGIASVPDRGIKRGRVKVIGIDGRFWELSDGTSPHRQPQGDEVIINSRLAAALGASVGDELLLRVDNPSAISRDAPLAKTSDASVAFRARLIEILGSDGLGRFSLESNQLEPYNAFVPLELLQRKTDLVGRANLLLVEDRPGLKIEEINSALEKRWKPGDARLIVEQSKSLKAVKLTTERVFLDDIIAKSAVDESLAPVPILTYFVNSLSHGGRSTPYSMVTALDPSPRIFPSLPQEIGENELIATQWLADDLDLKVGDEVNLTYFVISSGRKLKEETRRFTVKSIIPMDDPAVTTDLMPEFPGISGSENCRDWDPGIPIDLDKIRDKDERYWDEYRGAPKAFISLAAGQRMWRNRFGGLTAVLYPSDLLSEEAVRKHILASISPSDIGLFAVSAREEAIAASNQSIDFGQLFLGLSFFLVFSSVLLTALLFVFSIQQRSSEIGTLKALGFKNGRIKAAFLIEGLLVVRAGGLLGLLLGALSTKIILVTLTSVWRGAVANSVVKYHLTPGSAIIGYLAGIFIALAAMWIVLTRNGNQTARELLAADFGISTDRYRAHRPVWIAVQFGLGLIFLIAALALVATSSGASDTMKFFVAGFLLLASGVLFASVLIRLLGSRSSDVDLTIAELGRRNAARRYGRSIAVIALISCGMFLIVAINANRLGTTTDIRDRSSGTGGFAYYAETTLPVHHDLNSTEGLSNYGLTSNDLGGAKFVQLRIREGDDASCLNLNRAQTPRLLGVDPHALANRNAFRFIETISPERRGWDVLDEATKDRDMSLPLEEDVIPAVGDEGTIVWAIGKKLGDELIYTNDFGRKIRVKISGMITGSILQGSLIISESAFIRNFPSISGYRLFLIDPPSNVPDERFRSSLMRGFEDYGIEIMGAGERLASFHVVQNTYLSIFQMLGGLGFLLGTAGLFVVVLRNVMERRSELAILRALGLSRKQLVKLILSENWLLLLSGIGIGIVSALVAIYPVISSPGVEIPYRSLLAIVGSIAIASFLWVGIAARISVKGELMSALRNE